MPRSLQTLVLVSLAGLILPQAVLAVEPSVGVDTKSNAQLHTPDHKCIQVPDTYRTSGPFTVRELETESLRKAGAEWKEFLRQLRKGDELFTFDEEGCCTGIIIVRKGCIVDWFQLSEP